jgi:diacylglycerol kinase family enzyme
MRYAAVVNAAAGAASRLGTTALTSTLNERLEHNLLSLRYTDGRGLCTACDDAIREKPDALLILGGDGTCRTAAAMAAERKVPIVLLPGGTMNVLPKRVWGAETFEQVLERVASGDVEAGKLDMGDANGQGFFVAAMFGLMPALARVRERFRGASTRETLAALGALGTASRHVLKSSVRISAEELPTSLRTAGSIVSVGDADQLLPWRQTDEGFRAFECVALNLATWRDAGRIAFKTLRHGDWRGDSKIDNFTTRALRADSGRSTWITLDGEPVKLRGPVDVAYKKDALTIVAPRQSGAANDNANRASVRSSLSG